MRLTTFSDYTLRTLTYLALHPDRFVTIAEIAAGYRVSSNHLMKVVQHLGATGTVVTLRGQHGGVRLARPPHEIRLGQVIRATEPSMVLAPACDTSAPALTMASGRWSNVLDQATTAFIGVLDDHTLADLIAARPA